MGGYLIYELGMMWNEANVAYFMVLSVNLSGEAEESLGNLVMNLIRNLPLLQKKKRKRKTAIFSAHAHT
jgi:hypothetical protein